MPAGVAPPGRFHCQVTATAVQDADFREVPGAVRCAAHVEHDLDRCGQLAVQRVPVQSAQGGQRLQPRGDLGR
ncbi:hypothetical protein GCM10009634_04850 [Saccharothrix xinjiangensis]